MFPIGCPELGYISLTELRSVRGKAGLISSETRTSKPTSISRHMPTRRTFADTSSANGDYGRLACGVPDSSTAVGRTAHPLPNR
jgi:hypothetical protein